MLAVNKQTKVPLINARKATFVIAGRRSAANALNDPTIIPNELGLANPQIEKVAIAALRPCRLQY